jgi:hypothetical protein
MRIRRLLSLAVVAALTASCSGSETSRERSHRDDASVEALTATGATGSNDAPDPEARIPARPERLAQVLEDTIAARSDAVAAWTSGGGAQEWPVPEDVELWALYEQRIYRLLATKERLTKRVVQRLPKGLAGQARLISGAGRALYEHTTPVRHVPDFRIRKPDSADSLLAYFREAQDRFHVAWEVLAAVMLVETRMGRIRSSSSSGAQGPMQFLPSTWDAYGLGGDVRDPHDAVLGAANYLHASGAPRDYRRALYAYNPLDAYVTAVWSYAKAMMRTPSLYDAFYNWQVFVRTTHGDVRLSGPGFPV